MLSLSYFCVFYVEAPLIQSFSAFNSIFNKNGLFGIYASTSSNFVSDAVDISAKELIAIATPGEVTQEQLDRAKKTTESAVLMNLESRMIASEDIGRQVLTYGERCILAFLANYKILVPKLLCETMTAIGSSFISHINLAVGDAVPETKALAKGLPDILSGDMKKGIKIQTKHLEALIELHNTTGTFARNIQHLFSDSDLQVLKAIYLPYESFKQR